MHTREIFPTEPQAREPLQSPDSNTAAGPLRPHLRGVKPELPPTSLAEPNFNLSAERSRGDPARGLSLSSHSTVDEQARCRREIY